MDSLFQDVRFALRSLAKAKGFTAVVVVVMALAIGVNVTVFAMVYGFLWRPWPLPDPGRIVSVSTTEPRRGFDDLGFSWPNYLDVRERAKSFEYLGGEWGNTALVTLDRDPERLSAEVITSDVFPALGVHVQLGRNFTRDESVWNHNWRSVIISDRIWRTRYHADPRVLGRTLRLNGRVREIVGVAPPGFRYPETQDFWIPNGYNPADNPRSGTALELIGRLKPGVTVAQADAEVKSLFAGLRREHPELKENDAVVVDLQTRTAKGSRPYVMFLLYAVVFVLLVACANVANLMLARAASRRREIGLRRALGASRGRIVRQLLTESVIVSLAAGAIGVLLGYWGGKLWPLGVPLEMPFYIRFPIDAPVLLYTAAITVAAGVVFGLAPALHASGENFVDALREGSSQSGTSLAGRRLRSALVVAEVALSLVLLIGAGLMVRSFTRLRAEGDQLRPDGVVTAQILLPIASYPDDPSKRRFLRDFVERVRNSPGVHEVSGMSDLPLGRNRNGGIVRTPAITEQRDGVLTDYETALPGALHLLGLGVRKGRGFTADDDEHAPLVALVSESLARRLFKDRDPIGQRIRFFDEPDSIGWRTIVGVTQDVVINVENHPMTTLCVWTPEYQDPRQFVSMLVRADGDGAAGAGALRKAMRALDPNLPLIDLRTLRAQLGFALWVERLLASMLTVVSVLALVIAAVGLHGVVAYNVVQRTREIGIRMALGADASNVVGMIVGQALRLTVIGLVIGLAGAFALTRFISTAIAGVSPTDPPTFTVVVIVLAFSGLLAAWAPARRATRVDPMVALRYE